MAGENERVSRPSSLVLEAPPPEREPLRFDVQVVGAPPEVEELVNNIKQVAENFLYHWKTFPIVLPPSRFTGHGNRPSDIIVAPPCDELDAAALDAGMEPHPLSPKQLHAIREKGEFEVPSRHFPGQIHVWRVAPWLQRGRQRAREDLYKHVARATAIVVIVARDRLLKDVPFSAIAGGKALLQGLHRLLDLAIGMPSMEARDLDKKIREERSRYLVAELICKPEYREDVAALAAWVWRAVRRAAAEKGPALPPPPPPAPCLYSTPQRTQVDLRLYRREVMRKALPLLQSILEREARGWFLHFRQRRAALLASQKVPPKDMEEEVRVAALREYVSRVCNAVSSSAALRALGSPLPDLLCAQLRAALVMMRAEEEVLKKLNAGVATAEARIRASHPILSWSDTWRREKMEAARERLSGDLRWAPLEEAAAAMQTAALAQHKYFLLRYLAFLRDREPLLIKELRAAKTPTREFTWATRIWFPKNWVVTRHFRGRAERIPTVVSRRATSIVTPRSDPSQPVFLVDRESIVTTATRWPGWRLLNAAHRTWCWCWNLMFFLGVLVPWCSPLSLRTLLAVTPFVPDYDLSQVNGTLFPKRSSETQTMWSRLLKLWRHVSKERTRFETEPDTGLLGKGLSRQANRCWNYGIVGGLGTAIMLLLFPVAAIAVSALSAALALAVPLWVPPLALTTHLINALFYDLDCPDPKKLNRYFALFEVVILRILILGILQPLAAIFVAVVICPLSALIMLVGGVWWWWVRCVWECVWWGAVIRRCGRVPAHDSAFCRRVHGPGLKHPPFYLMTCGQAVAAVCARAETEVLACWARGVEKAIERPLRDYEHFVHACFRPFSLQIAKTGAYKQLEKECAELTASLREKVATRRRELALGLSDAARARVKMTSHDLRCAVRSSAVELARVWAGVEAARGEDWWAARGLDMQDWRALAANTLVEVFDPEVVVSLEEGAAAVPLEAGAGAGQWEARCGGACPPDVLAERAHWTHRPHSGDWENNEEWDEWSEWGGRCALRVAPPTLDPDVFSPRAHWHPPVPHPAVVALVLYNRDSDNPVPLDSELCAEILKSLEDAPELDDTREVERYRGGGSSEGSEGSSSGTPHEGDEEDAHSCDSAPRDTHREPSPDQRRDLTGVCRVSPQTTRAECRWTLTGRGVRLRADLASPEDVTLDTDRMHQGTSV